MSITNVISKYFKFDESLVRVEGTFESPLFSVRDVCNILNIVSTNDVIKRLDAENLTQVKIASGSQARNMVFVNEEGLYELIFRSNKPIAKSFRKWVFKEVLPKIRREGYYILEERVRQIETTKRKEELQLLMDGAHVLKEVSSLDDRAKAMIASSALNIISEVQRQEPADEEYSISRRVQEICGRRLSSKNDKLLLSKIGKQMATAYRSKKNKDPCTRSQFVDGTLREVKSYTLRDFLDFGDRVIIECI